MLINNKAYSNILRYISIMANTVRYTFRLMAALAIPISIAAGQLLMVNAFQSVGLNYAKDLDADKHIRISSEAVLTGSMILAALLIIATASQTASPTWKKMDEWGHRLDNKFAEWKHGREYYLDKAFQLRKEANKLQHSAEDNILELSQKFAQAKMTFPILMEQMQVQDSPHEQAIQEDALMLVDVKKALNKCLVWLYKLDIADGSISEAETCTSYYSASAKLRKATDKLNISRDLLVFHEPPVSNYKDKHSKLGEKIEKDKTHIISDQSAIRNLKADIISAYQELYKLECLLTRAPYKESKIRQIDNVSHQFGNSSEQKKKHNYQLRLEKDRLLPININSDQNNFCINNVKNKKALNKQICCPFFNQNDTKQKVYKISQMPNSNSGQANENINEQTALLGSITNPTV